MEIGPNRSLSYILLEQIINSKDETCSEPLSKAGLVPDFGLSADPVVVRSAVGHCRQRSRFFRLAVFLSLQRTRSVFMRLCVCIFQNEVISDYHRQIS